VSPGYNLTDVCGDSAGISMHCTVDQGGEGQLFTTSGML